MGIIFGGVLKRAALLAVVLVTAGCGSAQRASGPKPNPGDRYLVYEQLIGKKGIWIAGMDGSHPRLLVREGHSPVISPDGKWVAYVAYCDQGESCAGVYVIPTSGSKPRRISNDWEPFTWSPDSKRIVVTRAPFSEETLVSIDVASGKESKLAETLAEGEFLGWSFSSDGKQIVYARANPVYENSDPVGDEVDLFVIDSDGGAPKRITDTGESGYPVWGPHSIAFSRLGGRNEIWQIQPDGSGSKRITDLPDEVLGNGFVDLTPVGWSENGRALLAGGENAWGSIPVAVNPDTGEARKLAESETIHTAAISHDGRFVLAYTHPPLEEPDEETATVLIVPYAGGKPTIVARGASSPSWNR